MDMLRRDFLRHRPGRGGERGGPDQEIASQHVHGVSSGLRRWADADVLIDK
jgi:hypothetical protein